MRGQREVSVVAKVRMTPSEAIVETLVAEGVDHVSGARSQLRGEGGRFALPD